MSLSVYAETTAGNVRSDNEDYVIADNNNKIFIIADGVGGNQAGEIASKFVATAIYQFLSDDLTKNTKENLNSILVQINKDLISKSENDPLLMGMSTTLVFSLIIEESFLIGNIGDSRGYLFRNGKLTQITKDHSVVQELLDSGVINEEEAFNHHLKHMITMALGNNTVEPDFYESEFRKGDILILCSDGLSDMVTDLEIESILNINETPKAKLKMLSNKALENGGFDNISIILINK